jgi:PAS domain S-box-containing protein
VVLGVVAVNGAVALLAVYPVLDHTTTSSLVERWALVPISILAGIAPWVGLPPMRSKRESVFWALWTTGMAIHLCIRIIYIAVPELNASVSGSLTVDVLYVLFYLPLILSVLVRPDRPPADREMREPRALDFVATGVLSLALLAYFIGVPATFNMPEYETWVPSLIMYWVFDVYILLNLLYLRGTAPCRDWRILYTWLALAPACWVITELIELSYFLTWHGQSWPVSGLDVIWYVPWIAITLAGRMRAHPLPTALGWRTREEERLQGVRDPGRPGWVLVAAMTLPLVHFVSNLPGLLQPASRDVRELTVVVALALLLGIAFVQQRMLEARTLALSRRSRELEERQKLLAVTVEQSSDGVVIADREGTVRYVNPAFRALRGGPDDAIGEPLLRTLPPGLDERAVVEAMREGRQWEGRGGAERDETVSLSPIRDPGGAVEHWVLVRRDITELHRLEHQLWQARNMEALGTLAGEIAHQFEDAASKIYGHGQLLKEGMPGDAEYQEDLLGLLGATERAAELVTRILRFSRQREEETGILPLDVVVLEALVELRPTLPPAVRVVERVEPGAGEVRGVRRQLRQIVLNLGANAAQAMAECGGTLTVEVRPVTVEQAEADELGLSGSGRHLLLSVGDEGRGMDEATRTRIFEPFFTTKEMGMGAGLGLYLVQGGVSALGGAIRVRSIPGEGSVFEIFLPPADLIP